jgi:hypothetical protein
MLGMMQMFTGFLTASPQSPGALKPDAVKLSAQGKTVRLAVSISQEQIEQIRKEYETQQARMSTRSSGSSVPKPTPVDTGLVIQDPAGTWARCVCLPAINPTAAQDLRHNSGSNVQNNRGLPYSLGKRYGSREN